LFALVPEPTNIAPQTSLLLFSFIAQTQNKKKEKKKKRKKRKKRKKKEKMNE